MEVNVFGFEANIFALFSVVFSLAAYVPYIVSILKKEVQPERTSWVTWLILDVLIVVSYIHSGAKETVGLPIAYTIGALIVVILSIRHGEWVGFKHSLACFIGSAIGIALWVRFSSAEIGLYCFIGVLTISMWPTLKKAHKKPHSENLSAWIMWFVAALFSIFALGEPSSWEVPIASIPMAYLVLNVPIILTIVIRRRIKKHT